MNQIEKGWGADDIIFDGSPLSGRRSWNARMDRVIEAISEGKEGNIFSWERHLQFGGDTRYADLDSRPQQGYLRQGKTLFFMSFRAGLRDQAESGEIIVARDSDIEPEYKNDAIVLSEPKDIAHLFSVACRALEAGVDPEQIEEAAETAKFVLERATNRSYYEQPGEYLYTFAQQLSERLFL